MSSFGEMYDVNIAPIFVALTLSCVMTPIWVLGLALAFRWVVRRMTHSAETGRTDAHADN